jgi:hypothetical protein
MSGRIVYTESPVSKYGDRLATLRDDIHGYVTQLVSDCAVVRRSDVPNRANVVAAYDAAVLALRAAVDALGTHAADVKKYVDLRKQIEDIYKSLQPALKNMPEIEAAQKQAEQESLFGDNEFWIQGAETTWDTAESSSDQWGEALDAQFAALSPTGKMLLAEQIAERAQQGDTTVRGAWLYAATHSPGGAFIKSMGTFASVVGVVFDVHSLAVHHKFDYQTVSTGADLAVSTTGLVAGGANLFYAGTLAEAPAWVGGAAAIGAWGGAVTGGIAIGVPIGLYMEGRYEQFEGQGINGWTHIAKNDPIVLVPEDEAGYAWHKMWEGIGTAVYGSGGNYQPGTYLPNDQFQVVMKAIQAKYPDAHVMSVDGGLRVVVPDHLGGWSTMLTVDIKTGATR